MQNVALEMLLNKGSHKPGDLGSRKDAKAQSFKAGKENDIAKIVVDCAFHIHQKLGPGLLESAYEAVLIYELEKRGLKVQRQMPIPIRYDGITLDEGFRADILVEDLIVVELKSVEEPHPVHKKQLITYLKLTNKRLGLLINFGSPLIKDGITRIVNGLEN